ncbi:hypothetical protein C7S16_5517 [Burkholderia thailandensis]|uniref:Uncharacterized protein n=1 Tax=Burkholderia thailandensis TaxID=57975 RepID=A0AAW9CQR2_BURTH|nr:hypothetical protein [Burkholderia thailandensis]MDW9252929.1 hypothetical protein [Burkholderia thailandensis]
MHFHSAASIAYRPEVIRGNVRKNDARSSGSRHARASDDERLRRTQGRRVAHRASGFHMPDGIVRLPAHRVEARKRNARAAGDTLRAARSASRA